MNASLRALLLGVAAALLWGTCDAETECYDEDGDLIDCDEDDDKQGDRVRVASHLAGTS